MAEHNLEEILTKIITQVAVARADDVVTFNEVLGISMTFVTGITHIVNDLQDRDSMEDLIDECQGIFEVYIRPLDIKGVPNLLERFVDNFLYDTIDGGIRSVYYFMHEAE